MESQTMLAARVYGKDDLRLEQVKKPDVHPDSIRVRVRACAICGTDKRIYRIGDYRAKYPVIIGHEIAGVVEAVGRNAKGVREGDRVCVIPGFGCGACRNCRKGHPNACLHPHEHMGYAINGGFAEYLDVPVHIFQNNFVKPIPESLSFDEACLAEIIACANNAQMNVKVEEGDHVLILGAGPAGIIHAHLSKMYGAERVTLAQRTAFRLENAKKIFPDAVDDTICMNETDLEEAYLERNDGRAPDVVIVCAPSRSAQEMACKMVAQRGRVNFFAGLPQTDKITSVDANQLHYKEYTITGASSSKPIDSDVALDVLTRRIIDGEKMITARFPLDRIHDAFALAENKDCIKVVVNP